MPSIAKVPKGRNYSKRMYVYVQRINTKIGVTFFCRHVTIIGVDLLPWISMLLHSRVFEVRTEVTEIFYCRNRNEIRSFSDQLMLNVMN